MISPWVPGGFAGVDVFFVISGFLMTGIIFRGFESNSFNLFKFYVARANRIIPALAVLCSVLLVIGWFFINPISYSVLGKHIASSMGFFSNVIYWYESGYFDLSAHTKWLLHTWSLSVEWQFYLIYPIFLIILKKRISILNLKKALIVGVFLGFVFSVYATIKWPDPSYYLLPTRAWEMMFGGIAYIYPIYLKNYQKKIVEIFGLLLILLSYIFISSKTPWPGHFALIPVLGAYLVLIANRQNSIVTNNIIFQALGKWSYSIYLWHWPIVVFIYYFEYQNLWFIGIVSSIFIGWISFIYIESFRFPSYTHWKKTLNVKPIWSIFIVASVAFFVYQELPNKYLFPMPESIVNSIYRKPYACFDKENMHQKNEVVCQLTKGESKILALGDSHSYASLPVVENIANENGLELLYTGFSGCPPLLGISPIRGDQDRKNCSVLNEKSIQYAIENKVKKVFLAARWTYYTEGEYSGSGMQLLKINDSNKKADRHSSIDAFKYGLKLTLKRYFENGIDVVLMLQVPMQEDNPDKIYYKSINEGSLSINKLHDNSVASEKSFEFQKFTNNLIVDVANEYPNVSILNPSIDMCHNGYCAVGTLTNSYYFDDDHLSKTGALALHKSIKKILLNKNLGYAKQAYTAPN